MTACSRPPFSRMTETSPPAEEPVTLAEAKTYLRVDADNDDTLIGNLISAARIACEGYTARAFVNRDISVFADQWPVANSCAEAIGFSLPKPPLSDVSAIEIFDAAHSHTALAADQYFVDTVSVPGQVILEQSAMMPLAGQVANGIAIHFTAGYGAASDVPAPIRQAILQMTAYLYDNRGESNALTRSGAAELLQPFRILSVAP